MQGVNKKKHLDDRWLPSALSYLVAVILLVWGLLIGVVGSIALIVFIGVGLTFDAMMVLLLVITLMHWLLFGVMYYLGNRR